MNASWRRGQARADGAIGADVGDRVDSLVVRKFLQRIGAEQARRAIKKAMVDQGIPENAIEERHVDTVWMEILQDGT